MTTPPLDRILFGDNQFFGVNHMSEDKARAQAMRFRDTESIIRVLDTAYELGIRGFMCTTHEQIAEVARHVAAHPSDYDGFTFYPGMPYAHKYANMVSELGMMGTLKELTPGGIVEALVRGAKSTLRRDIGQLMKMLVDAEMAAFRDVPTPVIFLQNVVSDLLLGLGMGDMFGEFARYVRERYEAEAGFFTMNLPAMVDALHAADIENPIICCNYNKIGFRMSGGVDVYDRTLEEKRFRCIAMSVLASGAIPAREAIEWVCERKQIESIVFGASSRANIAESVELINRFSANDLDLR
jgi:hypothetical protein